MERDDLPQVVLAHGLRQPNLSGQGTGIGVEAVLRPDQSRFVGPLPCLGLGHTDDDHLIVSQQIGLDRIRERQAIELRPKPLRVIHRRQLKVEVLGLGLDPLGEIARRGGHKESLLRFDLGRIEDHGKATLGMARASVRFVGNDQVKGNGR